MSVEIKIPKKLIETSIPLIKINEACKAESSPFVKKHPRSLHIWWARRRLAAVRAVIFAQMINDPGFERNLKRGVNKTEAELKRKKLFNIIERLVKWENLNNEALLSEARQEVYNSWKETCELNKSSELAHLFNPEVLPGFHDPFAGGGAIPMEASRLGLNSFASDLNPVAVLINKVMIELPQRFLGKGPFNPTDKNSYLDSEFLRKSYDGLKKDINYYASLVNESVKSEIDSYYPKIHITKEMAEHQSELQSFVGKSFDPIGWIWARTVPSPNPAFSNFETPLVSSFWLSKSEGKECWIEPLVDKNNGKIEFRIQTKGNGPSLIETVNRKGATCLFSNSPISFKYIREVGKNNGGLKTTLMAVVANINGKTVYVSSKSIKSNIQIPTPTFQPNLEMPKNPRDFKSPNYGITNFGELFTDRQIFALNAFSNAIRGLKEKIISDIGATEEFSRDEKQLCNSGAGATAYAELIQTLLSLATSRWIDLSNSFVTWNSTNQNLRALFSKQAIPMIWDFVEVYPFGKIAPWLSVIDSQIELFDNLPKNNNGVALQAAAQLQDISKDKIISTDPPYYDNINYAELSDFFYIWQRHFLKDIFPDLYKTLSVPKGEELVASVYRHETKNKAETFFQEGMFQTFKRLYDKAHPAFPLTIYYAFKQSETSNDETTSSGWVSFLQSIVDAGFCITGTWPLRTEREQRSIGIGSNALASSVLLVLRKRSENGAVITRREFIRQLNSEIPEAIKEMVEFGGENLVAPVDLSQAVIGPGMGIFSSYKSVIESNGAPMTVDTALKLINRYLADDDFDNDTQFCITWFESFGWSEGKFGEADVLARAKGTSVDGLKEAGVAESSAGKFALIKWENLPHDWNSNSDNRAPIWEILHHLIKANNENGENEAGKILSRVHAKAEAVRSLAYRLYTVCERKKWAQEAASYNNLILAWDSIEVSAQAGGLKESQIPLFDSEINSTEKNKKAKRTKS